MFALALVLLQQPEGASPDLLAELKSYRPRILFESNRDGNFELYVANADGSSPVNLTKTADVQELYPKASPDGSMICFTADEGEPKVRNLYVMKADGGGRRKFADNAREPCWNHDGTAIAYLKGETDRFTYSDFATKGIFIWTVADGKTREHPNNAKIEHLYTLNWASKQGWFVATVHGGMGFKHGILALQENGTQVVDLKLEGCRPDVSADGLKISWGHGDFAVGVGDLDLAGGKVSNTLNVVQSKDPIETYHCDWSPDGRYLSFTLGPKMKGKNLKGLLPEFPGVDAPGWDICVADASKPNRWVALTLDGKSNKESDWVP